ncbi:MAG: non-heme iron oxygenase ferredoxin subunit [Anaerolineales bacterium]|nr:non-heme iron oxygenase ferredoxin subunit [Anaerolineales bacterium]
MYNYAKLDPEQCDFVLIGQVDELENGGRLFVEVDNLPIVVFRVADEVFAIADTCSHEDAPLGDGHLQGYEIICPRHGARFDVRTGKALALPAVVDIPAYPVRIREGQIEVGIPLEK